MAAICWGFGWPGAAIFGSELDRRLELKNKEIKQRSKSELDEWWLGGGEGEMESLRKKGRCVRSGQIDSGDRRAAPRAFFFSALPTALTALHLTPCETMSATYNPDATLDDATWVAVLLVSSSDYF